MAETKVSMKLMIDTGAKRVLFAEAGKDCVDFLFNMLTLPVATVIRLLREEGMKGSLPNLYKSLEDLNDDYIEPHKKKDTYLKPAAPVSSSSAPQCGFGPAFDRVPPKPDHASYLFSFGGASDRVPPKPDHASNQFSFDYTFGRQSALESGGLVKGMVTYMVMDDLEIKPMSTISSITLLNKFNVKDVGALKEKVVNLGVEEAIKLLKFSLQSENVLTELFC